MSRTSKRPQATTHWNESAGCQVNGIRNGNPYELLDQRIGREIYHAAKNEE
ncbi:hypothetical protein MY10362_005012 [Beauveria mimosiformis]